MPRRAIASLAALALALAAGCASAPAPAVRVIESRIDHDHRPTYMGLPLASGQLILTESQGGVAVWISTLPERFYRFTHAGFVSIEEGRAYVYDMTGGVAGIPCGGSPLDVVKGGLRRSTLEEYMAPNLYAEIFDLPAGVDPAKVMAFMRATWDADVEFDAYFDYCDHKKLCCTEFVELALEAGGKAPAELVPYKKNASVAVTLAWLKVPMAGCIPAGIYEDPARRVASLGIFGTRTNAAAYFAAKRELNRRFTSDQKLGNLFDYTVTDIVLRPELVEFLRRAAHLFDGARVAPDDAAVEAGVRELADDTFGPPRPVQATTTGAGGKGA